MERAGEIIKRLLSGVFLTIPMAFVGLILCLVTVGVDIPLTPAQSIIVGLGAVSGFVIGAGVPGVSALILSFFAIVFGGGE